MVAAISCREIATSNARESLIAAMPDSSIDLARTRMGAFCVQVAFVMLLVAGVRLRSS
jgi:hypothetical protein